MDMIIDSPRLAQVLESFVIIPEFEDFIEFLESGFSLDKKDFMSTYDLRLTPWNKVVAKWLSNQDPCQWVWKICGTQIGKTALQMAWLLYLSKKEIARLMYVNSFEDETRRFIANRLKPFIEDYDAEILSKKAYRTQDLQVGKVSLKLAYGTSEKVMKSDPCAYIIGDECAMWTLKDGIKLAKKRTRTYKNRKGFFATSPPEFKNHESIREAFSGNVYRWYVPCVHCENTFPLLLPYLRWYEKEDIKEPWDYSRVKDTANIECPRCAYKHFEEDKEEMLNEGKEVCVDPENEYKPTEEAEADTKCLQIPSTYSMFTEWAELAVMFLDAKKTGGIGRFMRDEMAEVPEDKEVKESIAKENVKHFFIRRNETREETIKSMDAITAGVDKQKDSLYITVMGWRRGLMISGHVLDAHKMMFAKRGGEIDWAPFIEYMSPYQSYMPCCVLDSSAGVDKDIIESMCGYYGPPYHPLKDTYQAAKIAWKTCENGVKRLSIHSDQIKDEIANALSLAPSDPNAWTFPDDLDDEFFVHMQNEHKVQIRQKGKEVLTWRPVYESAPQHFFSSFVYAVAAMNTIRDRLQGTARPNAPRRGRRMLNRKARR
jgi:phage terminase large subunit GpA-like protein